MVFRLARFLECFQQPYVVFGSGLKKPYFLVQNRLPGDPEPGGKPATELPKISKAEIFEPRKNEDCGKYVEGNEILNQVNIQLMLRKMHRSDLGGRG